MHKIGRGYPLVLGHRGASGYAPENTMKSFKLALDLNADGVELDVQMTYDGKMVVIHDELIDRTSNGKGWVKDHTLEELKEFNFNNHMEGYEFCEIPTLDEVLELYEPSGLPLLIELKTARGNHFRLTEAVCRRLDSYSGEFVIESFDPRVLIDLRKLRPDIIRGQLVQDFMVHREDLPLYQALMLTDLVLAAAGRPDFIAYRMNDKKRLTWKFAAGPAGLAQAVWTVRTPEKYRKAIASGCVPIFERFDPDEKEE